MCLLVLNSLSYLLYLFYIYYIYLYCCYLFIKIIFPITKIDRGTKSFERICSAIIFLL